MVINYIGVGNEDELLKIVLSSVDLVKRKEIGEKVKMWNYWLSAN